MRLRTSGRRCRGGAFLAVLASIVSSAPLLGQGKDEKQKVDDAQRAEAQALVDLVEGAAQGKPAAPGGADLKWGRHYFLKAQGDKTYVPFVLLLPSATASSPSVGLYLRVVARGGSIPPAKTEGASDKAKTEDSKTEDSQYTFEDLYFFDLPPAQSGTPHRITRAFAVPPGEYDVYVAIKERPSQKSDKPSETPAKSGVVHQAITVPNFNATELTTSDVIVAEKIETLSEPISTETQADHPFTFGQMQIVPAIEHRLSKKDELQIVFWVYGAGTDAQTKKPNANIEYKFHRVEGEKQTYFNKTEPQPLNAQTLPPQFDMAAGHQLSGSLGVPLASFPDGEYRLEIEVQDKAAGKQVTRDVRFTVGP
jgi:hypothetical protein